MKRLLYVMPFTHDIERMKNYYRDVIGLELRNESPFFVQFESGSEGASFALLAIQKEQEPEVELCFETDDVDADFAALEGRGVEFLRKPRMQSFGKVAHLRDPEGNVVSLLEPSPGIGAARASATSKPDPLWQAGLVGALAAGAHSAPTALATAVGCPRFSTAILNCLDMDSAKTFYRDKLGLRLETDSAWWVAFGVGGSTLALHPRVESPVREHHHGRAITLGFTVGNLIGWADEARERGVHFATAPANQGFGLAADATDPDGNELTFREPPALPVLEEQLAEEFDDDESPSRSAFRKPVRKGVHAASRVAVKPEYKTGRDTQPGKAVRTRAAKLKGKRLPSIRGAGPERTRLAPKNQDDPQRPKLRQAVGRLKKAERRSVAEKKVAVANSSKSKPVKRAAASRGRKKR